MAQLTYHVHVVEKKRVFTENRRFTAANPQFNGVLECLFVGMTSKTPDERFRPHKTGYVNKKVTAVPVFCQLKFYDGYDKGLLFTDNSQQVIPF